MGVLQQYNLLLLLSCLAALTLAAEHPQAIGLSIDQGFANFFPSITRSWDFRNWIPTTQRPRKTTKKPVYVYIDDDGGHDDDRPNHYSPQSFNYPHYAQNPYYAPYHQQAPNDPYYAPYHQQTPNDPYHAYYHQQPLNDLIQEGTPLLDQLPSDVSPLARPPSRTTTTTTTTTPPPTTTTTTTTTTTPRPTTRQPRPPRPPRPPFGYPPYYPYYPYYPPQYGGYQPGYPNFVVINPGPGNSYGPPPRPPPPPPSPLRQTPRSATNSNYLEDNFPEIEGVDGDIAITPADYINDEDEQNARSANANGHDILADPVEFHDSKPMDTKDVQVPFDFNIDQKRPRKGTVDQVTLIYKKNYKAGRKLKEAEKM